MPGDVELLERALRHWPGARLLGPLEGGHRNTVFLAERNGSRYVAKTTRRSEASLRWTVEVMRAANKVGFVVPYFVQGQTGSLVADGVTLEPFVAGEPASMTDLAGMFGRLERFHLATRTFPQRPDFASATELLTKSRGGDVDFTGMPAALVATCRAAWQALLTAPCSAVHGDLNPANMLKTPSGKLALLDWDEARRDASLFDRVAVGGEHGLEATSDQAVARALLAWEVAVSWTVEPEHARRQALELGWSA